NLVRRLMVLRDTSYVLAELRDRGQAQAPLGQAMAQPMAGGRAQASSQAPPMQMPGMPQMGAGGPLGGTAGGALPSGMGQGMGSFGGMQGMPMSMQAMMGGLAGVPHVTIAPGLPPIPVTVPASTVTIVGTELR